MPSATKFTSLGLHPDLLRNLTDIGYTDMTLVQAETLPQLIGGPDVLARAKTGSGKTAAYGQERSVKGAGESLQQSAFSRP